MVVIKLMVLSAIAAMCARFGWDLAANSVATFDKCWNWFWKAVGRWFLWVSDR